MSDDSDFAKLNFISELISDIELILNRHAGSAKALADVEGKHALLMCLQQIGEALGKIKRPEWQVLLETHQANAMRNVIAHDYLGVDPKIVLNTLDLKIPQLKEKVAAILVQNQN